RSTVALSVMMDKIGCPFSTGLPSFTSHSTTSPASMWSDIFGTKTSTAMLDGFLWNIPSQILDGRTRRRVRIGKRQNFQRDIAFIAGLVQHAGDLFEIEVGAAGRLAIIVGEMNKLAERRRLAQTVIDITV